MLISRKRFEIRKKGLPKRNGIREIAIGMRKLLHGLAGRPVCLRPYSEPGGNPAGNDVRAVFFTGVNALDIDNWISKLEQALSTAGVRSLKGKIAHYTLMLQPGERFTDVTARLALETLATELGYGTGDDYLTMSFWHTGAEKPEHLHMITCRVNIRDNSVLQECGGWFHVGLQKARAKIEHACGFTPSRNAALIYRDGEYLHRGSAEFERATGRQSSERLMKWAAEAIATSVGRGEITSWDAFLNRCGESGITYLLGPRGGGRLRSGDGFEIHASFWVPGLSRKNLETYFGGPCPAHMASGGEI